VRKPEPTAFIAKAALDLQRRLFLKLQWSTQYHETENGFLKPLRTPYERVLKIGK
jgi:hypothetical protein